MSCSQISATKDIIWSTKTYPEKDWWWQGTSGERCSMGCQGSPTAWTSNLVATNQVGPQPCGSQKSPYWLSTSKIEPRHKISKARWDGHKAQMSLQHSPGKDQGLWAFTEPPCPADVCPTDVIPDEIMKIHDSAAYSALWLSKHFSSVQIFLSSLC